MLTFQSSSQALHQSFHVRTVVLLLSTLSSCPNISLKRKFKGEYSTYTERRSASETAIQLAPLSFYCRYQFHPKPPPPPPPLGHRPGIGTKNLPPPWGFCIIAFARERGFVGAAPEGRAFLYKRCLPFWNFHYDARNWRLITLWGYLLL